MPAIALLYKAKAGLITNDYKGQAENRQERNRPPLFSSDATGNAAGDNKRHRLGTFHIQRLNRLFGKDQDIAGKIVGLGQIDRDVVLKPQALKTFPGNKTDRFSAAAGPERYEDGLIKPFLSPANASTRSLIELYSIFTSGTFVKILSTSQNNLLPTKLEARKPIRVIALSVTTMPRNKPRPGIVGTLKSFPNTLSSPLKI